MIYAAVLGYGTVGSGVAEVLDKNKTIINAKAGEEIKIKYILDIREFPEDKFEKLITHNFETILNDDDVKIAAEVMGGIEPAYTFVKKLLKKQKSVVTSNKALVEKYGAELLKTAKENGVSFFFEASVGGGIPIIRPLYDCITADDIIEIKGIFNGTTNYILTKMTDEGADYDDVLKDAQEKGYAERNPEADVEGYDTCRKTAILTSIITGRNANFESIYTEGITGISPEDISYAKKIERSIKLLASIKKSSGGYISSVYPALVGKGSPLHMVNGVFNAILLKGNMLGNVMFYGQGAGKEATASAVVSDIVDAARKNHTIIEPWSTEKLEMPDIDQIHLRKLIRIEYNDRAQALKAIENIFNSSDVIELEDAGNEFAFITADETEAEINAKITALINESCIENVIRSIRFDD